ncbi:hypothetical protein JH06_4007 [Blastocystis sp. subtype 4]|uniref:hypothetical protein n=1 Tax=Blastocystis sp. subtype 4 TaxID=944170 RepID=UPI00071174A8|nr:hypothetical protein JH06_4007 [Blastocystis sp. subtype 4]KNB44513.1 hypothetical protein JH06_4007 [Blastocystis sp. subtype 4]|eukprot:XP_014527948.1 hypothetical protein JH06_4007 [Blastocystis sp. subtype 4]
MFYAILLFTLVNGLLYVGIYQLLGVLFGSSFHYVSAAGFSGVIFSLLTLESYVIEVDTLPIFGLINVPRKWFAVVYLILMSVIMPGVSFIGHLCGVVSGFLFASGYLNWLVPMHCLVRVEKGCFGSMLKKSDAFIYIPELHQALGSCLSFGTMICQAYEGLKSVGKVCIVGILSMLKFIFDSIFPPVMKEEVPKPNLEINSDLHVKCSPIIYRESGVVSAEEARQKRLEALAARGIH